MPINIAIIGSGPAGFYTADALTRACKGCHIDIIERLPTPFGLVRAGVAPDHQTTKRIVKKFEKTALLDEVNYYGNVTIGDCVSLAELRELYDAVVLAVGAPNDRKLTIPGADKIGVHGSAAFVGWYNGHPDYQDLRPELNVRTAAVIGVGNVALDIARVLVCSAERMAGSDLPDYASCAIQGSPIYDIHLFGRRGPIEAKFTNVELREMGKLNCSVPLAKAEQIPGDDDPVLAALSDRDRRLSERNLKTLRTFSVNRPDEKSKRVHFEFCAAPVEVLGGDRVEALRFERTQVTDGRAEGTGDFFEVDCGLVVAAIGYRSDPIVGAPYEGDRGIIPNDDGRVAEGLYTVGWIKRGPTGVISSNRYDGEVVADYIHKDFGNLPKSDKAGRKGLESLFDARGMRYVTYADWKRLETMEIENATELAPCRKFVTIEEMLEALDKSAPSREFA